jgi:uncharacterized protein YciI
MFIIELTYKVPLEKIDAELAPHMAYLDKYYATGHFLASGRQEPRTGGIIFAKADSRRRMEDIVSKDPFNINGYAEYRIIEFKATKNIKAYKAFAGDE